MPGRLNESRQRASDGRWRLRHTTIPEARVADSDARYAQRAAPAGGGGLLGGDIAEPCQAALRACDTVTSGGLLGLCPPPPHPLTHK
jgi:hypothetical protein